MANESGLVVERLTDESIALMRQRIGYPNPTLRGSLAFGPWNRTATDDSIRHWALGIGDDNPLYIDPAYAATTRWGGMIGAPGYEMSMGENRSPTMDPDFAKATSKALRGIQLFNSGVDMYYHRPVRPGDSLFRSGWVASVEEKSSAFANRSVLVTNEQQTWNQNEEVVNSGSNWFIHTERRQASKTEGKYVKEELAHYTDEQLREIEEAYDQQYLRGADTLYIEDCRVGQTLPRMVKGPLTVTDLINFHMGSGWSPYGNYPHRLAYEVRKGSRGFYTRNEFNAWDVLQRVHWEPQLAQQVGVKSSYDIGPMRFGMLAHYLTNFAGDDGWVYYMRTEYRAFNYMGDTTWLSGVITGVRTDEVLGPLIEIDVRGVNQRGGDNLVGKGIILVASKATGPAQLPPAPGITNHRQKP